MLALTYLHPNARIEKIDLLFSDENFIIANLN